MCSCKQGTRPGSCPCGCRHTPPLRLDNENLQRILFDHLNGKLSLKDALAAAYRLGQAPPF